MMKPEHEQNVSFKKDAVEVGFGFGVITSLVQQNVWKLYKDLQSGKRSRWLMSPLLSSSYLSLI